MSAEDQANSKDGKLNVVQKYQPTRLIIIIGTITITIITANNILF